MQKNAIKWVDLNRKLNLEISGVLLINLHINLKRRRRINWSNVKQLQIFKMTKDIFIKTTDLSIPALLKLKTGKQHRSKRKGQQEEKNENFNNISNRKPLKIWILIGTRKKQGKDRILEWPNQREWQLEYLTNQNKNKLSQMFSSHYKNLHRSARELPQKMLRKTQERSWMKRSLLIE